MLFVSNEDPSNPHPWGFANFPYSLYTQDNAAYTTKNFESYHQHFFLNFLHVSFCNESKLRHVIKVTVYFFVTYRKKGSRIQFKAFS